MKTFYLFFQKHSIPLSGLLLFIFVSWSLLIIWQIERGKGELDNHTEVTSLIDHLSKDFEDLRIYTENDNLYENVVADDLLQERLQDIERNIDLLRKQDHPNLDISFTEADSLLQRIKEQQDDGQDASQSDMIRWVSSTIEELDTASLEQQNAAYELQNKVNSYWYQLYFIVFAAGAFGFFIIWIFKRQKEYVNEIEDSKEQAELTAQRKSDFLAMMSHEMRTPMNAVIGMTDLVMETKMSMEQEEYIRTIKIAGENLLSIINDVLDFSKLESGNMELNETPFNLEELISDVFNLMAIKVKEKNLETSWHLEEDVPDNIKTDKARLRQVLINLVGNAVKFTEEGKVALNVQMCGNPNGKHCLRFSVWDTGMGIPDDELPHLFDFFSQVDVNNKEGGTGLGLAISKEIVNLMNGEIDVESEINEGTTFYFTIYADAVVDEKELGLGKVEEPVQDMLPLVKDKHVLIAEDDQMNQLVSSRVIENLGFRVDVVSNGKQAVEAAGKKDYTFIFLDLQMPVMDGYEAVKEIRKLNGEEKMVKIIAMTGDAHPDVKDKCLRAGMDDYLSKPVQKKELHKIVLKWLEDPKTNEY